MRNLIPWRSQNLNVVPVTPFAGLDRDFDRMLQRFFGDAWGRGPTGSSEGWTTRIDVSETEDAFVVSAEVPGVDPEKLEISVQGDVLTLSGEKHAEETREEGQATYTERMYGTFRRDIPLGCEVDAAKAEAEHKHGVVTIRLPKAATVRPQRIEVKGR